MGEGGTLLQEFCQVYILLGSESKRYYAGGVAELARLLQPLAGEVPVSAAEGQIQEGQECVRGAGFLGGMLLVWV